MRFQTVLRHGWLLVAIALAAYQPAAQEPTAIPPTPTTSEPPTSTPQPQPETTVPPTAITLTSTSFATDAEIPAVWECRCSEEAVLQDAVKPEPEKPAKPVRTHWDMLLERRTREELQVLLDERLELLRSGQLRSRRSA